MALDLHALSRTERLTVAAAVALTVATGLAAAIGPQTIATFLIAAVSLAALAALIGQAVEQVGERFGPGPTGLLQSTLGNLPELFVGIFALREGLVGVVQAALVGSILANTLLVLGIAVLAGGLRHGDQPFTSEVPHMIAALLLLAVAALLVPTLAAHLHTAAASHAGGLSGAVAVVLIVVYATSIPYSLRRGSALNPTDAPAEEVADAGRLAPPAAPDAPRADWPETPKVPLPAEPARSGVWPLGLAIALLIVGSLGAAFASDWFVGALTPATRSLGLSQTFTGLVIVAIASNAVENVVGIRFAMTARPDFALSVILNSPLQIALLLTPLLVLISHLTGPTQLTLVFPPLEVCALAVATIVVLVVLVDGKYVWLEGIALIGLYCILAAAFWWG